MTARSALRGNEALTELAMLVGLGIVALIGHLVLLVLLYVAPVISALIFGAEPPPEDVIEVSLVSMPHTDSAMAQMDVRTETMEAPVDVEAPEPVEDPGTVDDGMAEPEVTPNPSDLTFKDETAKEAEGDPDQAERDSEREAKKRALLRESLIGALGSESSEAGDPDSTSSERIDLGGNGIRDPEAAAYIQKCKDLMFRNFNPLPQLKTHEPPYETAIAVKFDPDTGRIQSFAITKSSGNASWDGAAERAVEAVDQLPVPPDRIKPLFENGFLFKFNVNS